VTARILARRVPNPGAIASLKMRVGEAASFEVNGNECHELVLLTDDQ